MNIRIQKWKGEILLESLADSSLFDHLHVDSIEELTDEDGLWHVYHVLVEEDTIPSIGSFLKDGPWFIHVGKGDETIVIFKNTFFRFSNTDKDVIAQVKEYAKTMGIPEEELQFDIK